MKMTSKFLAAALLTGATAMTAHSAVINPMVDTNTDQSTALLLDFGLSSGFEAEIPASDRVSAQHVTLLGAGNDSFQWFAIRHVGGDFFVDIDDTPNGPSTDLVLGLYDFDPFSGSTTLLAQAETGGANSLNDVGSTGSDPFIELNLAPKVYFIGVAGPGSVFSTQSPAVESGTPIAQGEEFAMHVVIPEPSIALLGGLGLLGILRRRRN